MSKTAWRKVKQEVERRDSATVIEGEERYEICSSINSKQYSVYHLAHNGEVTFWDCIKTAYSLDELEYLFVD